MELRELWRFRDLVLTLALRDVKVRYKQTALGVAWVVLQPLMAAAIFAFVFGRVARFEAPGGLSYFLFSLAGLVAWTLFSGVLTKTGGVLVGNSHLVSKIYFPRLVLPLSAASSAVVDFAVGLGVLFTVAALGWGIAWPNLLFLPVVAGLFVLLALGVGLIVGALAVRYRDVGHMLPVLVQLLLYASPVAYPAAQVPEAYRDLYALNPLVGLLEAFRWSAIGAGELSRGYLAYSAAVAVGVFLVGAVVFRRLERTFADVI